MDAELPTSPDALAAWLRTLEARSGLSRGELARLTGADRKTVRRWLDGTTEPTGSKLLLLLSALGVRWEYEPTDLPLAVNAELAELRGSISDRLDALFEQLEGSAPEQPARRQPADAPPAEEAPQ